MGYYNSAYENHNSKVKACKFVFYILPFLAERWNTNQETAYRKMMKNDFLENYVLRFYDVLHTQGINYIIEDIDRELKVEN